VSFAYVGSAVVTLYLGKSMNFNTAFPYFLRCSGEIRYRKEAAEYLKVL